MTEFSIKTMFSPNVVEAAGKIPEELKTCSEDELIAYAKPTEIEWHIRRRFWEEYHKVSDEAKTGKVRKVRNDWVCEGVCNPTYFGKLLKRIEKACFILRPLQRFEDQTETQLFRSMNRINEILQMDITDKSGRVDPKRAGVLLQAVKMVTDRARGMATVKTQSMNLNINTDQNTAQTVQPNTPEQIDSRIAELEAKLGKTDGVIDAEVSE